MLKWLIFFIFVILILLLLLLFNSDTKYSSCIYDTKTNISYVYVDTKHSIKNIQNSLNVQDNIYYIKNGGLYHNGQLIKKLLGCTKEHVLFMNKKYGVQLMS